MAAPAPVKVVKVSGSPKRFNEFNLDYQKLLSDDFVADKLLTVKYTGKGQTFQLSGKGTLSYPSQPASEGTQEALAAGNEVKIVTNIEGKNVETKFDKSGIRTWVDLGVYELGRPLALSAKVKTTSAFKTATGWLAADYRGAKVDANLRVELKRENHPFLNTKVVLREGDLKVGLVTKVGLEGFAFRRHNFFVQYHKKDLDLYAEHLTAKGDKPLSLGTLVAAAVYRLNKHSLVAKTTYQVSSKKLDLVFGATTSLNDKTDVRAKVTGQGVLSLAGRYRHSNTLSVVAGTELNLKEPASNLRKTRTVPVPVGVSLEFTYN